MSENRIGAAFYTGLIGALYAAATYEAAISASPTAAAGMASCGIVTLLVIWAMEKRDQLLR